MFNALVVKKDDDGKTSAAVEQISEDDLPQAEVTVAVEYSTVNYKDGLCIGPGGGLVRNYPHVPGIDFAGTVESSDDDRYKPGDKVVLTGWRVGEAHWGGYSQKARVKADWLVPLPDGLDTRAAMAVGTAGFTAMLAVMALEDHGMTPGHGPVLVTGAAGGVGSVATAILANLGYEVAGVTGRPETGEYLKSLGATQIVAREEQRRGRDQGGLGAGEGQAPRVLGDTAGGAYIEPVQVVVGARQQVGAIPLRQPQRPEIELEVVGQGYLALTKPDQPLLPLYGWLRRCQERAAPDRGEW